MAWDTGIKNVEGRTQWSSFNGKWRPVVAKSKDGWTAEVLIPWTDLGLKGAPKPGHRIGFNLIRMKHLTGRKKGAFKYSLWAISHGSNTEVSTYGTLVLK